jgi:hypothetical protein
MQFSHLSPLAFLCIVPQAKVRRSSSGLFIELLPGTFWDMFQALLSEDGAVLAAVKSLQRPSRKRQEINE